MNLFETSREEQYRTYKEDVDIAIRELSEMKFYPVDGKIMCDLYAIPSFNGVSYFSILFEKDGRYDMVYARPQFYDLVLHKHVRTYPFKDAKKYESHPAKDGKIIMGIRHLPSEFVAEIKDILSNMPTVRHKDEGLVLDGYFQAIRLYMDNAVCDELIFSSEDELLFPSGGESLTKVLDELYVKVSELIG